MVDAVAVRDNAGESRYEIFVDGRQIGLMTYSMVGDTVTTPHTEIDPEFGRRGLGQTLVKAALDQFRERGLGVRPQCPFVRAVIARHPEYQDLVRGG